MPLELIFTLVFLYFIYHFRIREVVVGGRFCVVSQPTKLFFLIVFSLFGSFDNPMHTEGDGMLPQIVLNLETS